MILQITDFHFALTIIVLVSILFVFYIVWRYLSARDSRKSWWRTNVIYHIYPRSFNDTSGDGNGDLRGIIDKLGYFETLGVKVLYLSPIFKSPMADNGYDISDFKDINPMFGNTEDFDDLLYAVHERGLKLLLDFVPNHTSDQHSWFIESRQSKRNAKRNWYIWKDPGKDGGPPNNWVSVFGGSAWTYDPKTKQYYLHQFYKEQPDLNFRNPEVVEAMKEVLRFWLDKGVDGFRVDAVPHLFEDENFLDEPTLPSYDPKNPKYEDLQHDYTYNLDEVHVVIRGWREVCDEYTDSYKLLIGEVMSDADICMKYYGEGKSEFDFPFNFTLLGLEQDFTAEDVHKQVTDYLCQVPRGEWPNWLLGNHDVPRIGSKVGEEFLAALNVLILSLPGTPVMYYGDELGMVDVDIDKARIQDFRDPSRTPMRWTASKNAGFTPGKHPWLPIGQDLDDKNVQLQQYHTTSVFNVCSRMIHLRNTTSAFHGLQFQVVHVDQEVFAYTRFDRRVTYLIILNFGKGLWSGALDNIEGLATVLVDSTTIKEKGTRINVKQMMLHKGQAIVAKMD